MRPIENHLRALERDQAACNHAIELGEDSLDVLRGIDAFDDDWKIQRHHLDRIRVKHMTRSVRHRATIHGGPRQLSRAQQLDDLSINGFPPTIIAFADMNPHQDLLSDELVHGVPKYIPRLLGASLDRGLDSAHRSRMRRTFTVDEANRTLPLVRRIVSDAVRDYWRWQDAVREFEVAALRSSPDHPDEIADRLQGEATRLAEEIVGYMGELAELGVLFKGFDTGLVDFPG